MPGDRRRLNAMWVHRELAARVAERARENGVPGNEVVNEALCAYFGLDPAEYAVPRGRPGRPRKSDAERLRAGGLTLAQIGEALGVTRQRVHQLLRETD